MGANKDIGDSIKDKLGAFKVSPDDKVWLAIDKQLKKDRKKRLIFWFLFGVPIVLLLSFGLYHFAVDDKQQSISGREKGKFYC